MAPARANADAAANNGDFIVAILVSVIASDTASFAPVAFMVRERMAANENAGTWPAFRAKRA
jgi:hypothetical protein